MNIAVRSVCFILLVSVFPFRMAAGPFANVINSLADGTVEMRPAVGSDGRLTRPAERVPAHGRGAMGLLAQSIPLKAGTNSESLAADRIGGPLKVDSTRGTLAPEPKAQPAARTSSRFGYAVMILMALLDAAWWMMALRLTKKRLWRVLLSVFMAVQLAAHLSLMGGLDWPRHVPKLVFAEVVLWLSLPALPRALDGITIAHVSDVHVGRLTSGRVLRAMVNTTNALQADLVLLTCDLINYELADLSEAIGLVKAMPGRYGAWMVEGNHDLADDGASSPRLRCGHRSGRAVDPGGPHARRLLHVGQPARGGSRALSLLVGTLRPGRQSIGGVQWGGQLVTHPGQRAGGNRPPHSALRVSPRLHGRVIGRLHLLVPLDIYPRMVDVPVGSSERRNAKERLPCSWC
jgi:hypothetical protein